MKRDLELIIFDLDGTLYPANNDLDRVYPRAAIQLLARKTGRDIQELETEFLEKKAELKQILQGKPTSTLTLFYFYDVSFEEFENRVNSLIEIEKYIKPDPGAVQVIEKINHHYPLFLYTTNNGKVSDRILNYLGLSKFFPAEKRFTFSDAGRLPLPRKEKLAYVKPGLKGFTHILELHGVSPDRTLMVGDSEVSDMNPARQAGLLTYHITGRKSFYRLPAWLGL
jgi:FMN phosphatase YigB (HAD superfamily)